MKKILITYLILLLSYSFFSEVIAQIPDRAIDTSQYPANNVADSKLEAIFASYFEDANVSNLHVYIPQEEITEDYYFKGKELARGLFGVFDSKWRDEMPEDFKAFAISVIRGAGKPYYLIRFSGKAINPTIGLFEMKGNLLRHKAILASYWCDDNRCFQKDSWLQDFDRNVSLDILTKVRITEDWQGEKLVEEYYNIYKQSEDGILVSDDKMDVEVNNYFLYPHLQK
jgi:hypothetical protein